MNRQYERVCAEINLDNVKHNMDEIHKLLKNDTKIICVIKTDGYGHGSLPLAMELEQLEYVHGYGVATAEEALLLKDNGIRKPILIIGYSFPSVYEELIIRDVRLTVFRRDMLIELNETAKRLGLVCKVHIKVDTGMSRIGITPDDDGLQMIKEALDLSNIEVEGIFTHFARADEKDLKYAYKQMDVFHSFVSRIREELSYDIKLVHCSNSGAIIGMPEANDDCVRAGIIMYGLWPSEDVDKSTLDICPLLELKSSIVFVKDICKGTQVSYGGTFVAPHNMTIATVSIGYGDGYPRLLSNVGEVIVHGKRAKILGRVCMDQMMIDVTEIESIKEGDRVTLIGTDGEECITFEDLAKWSGMLNYELACVIGKRVPRLYRKGGQYIYSKDLLDDTPMVLLK